MFRLSYTPVVKATILQFLFAFIFLASSTAATVNDSSARAVIVGAVANQATWQSVDEARGSLDPEADAPAYQLVSLGKSYIFSLFGERLHTLDRLAFAGELQQPDNGSDGVCLEAKLPGSFELRVSSDGRRGVANAIVPGTLAASSSGPDVDYLLLCLRVQGTEQWRYPSPGRGPRFYILRPAEKPSELFSLWARVCLVAVLLLLSGLFSGLNLGLMSLDITELKVICRAGTPSERAYAKRIIPVRKRGNFLLCSLLLGNVVVNTSLSILIDSLIGGNGLIAIVATSFGIVILGEIIPQAVCTRYGLAIGAVTLPVTILFMALTALISFPLSYLLDRVLGQDLRQVYNRDKLKEFIVAQGLEKTEANIIIGALSLQKKKIAEVMRRLGEVYMLPAETLIDSFTIEQIRETGFSRIPIYERDRSNIVNVLNFKDLTIVNRDAPMRVDLVGEYFNRKVHVVHDTDSLDSALKLFLDNRVHMAIVKQKQIDTDTENQKETTVGMVTLEDILEEIIQEEIEDETDVQAQSSQRTGRLRPLSWRDLALGGTTGLQVPAQLRVAAIQNLAMLQGDLFGKKVIPEPVLDRMFNEKVLVRHMFIYGDDDRNTIYRCGVPADFGVFILEGRARLVIGLESLQFEAAIFTFLGARALAPVLEFFKRQPSALNDPKEHLEHLPLFVPDYVARAQQNMQYLRLSRAQYAALLRISDAFQRDFRALGVCTELDNRLTALFSAHFPRTIGGGGPSSQHLPLLIPPRI